jgi:predicted DNA-binding protein
MRFRRVLWFTNVNVLIFKEHGFALVRLIRAGVEAMPAVRNRTMGIKMTDEEHEQLEALAEARGQTMSDWGREVLLNQIGEPAGSDVVLAEVMALRGIVLNLIAAQALGETMSEDRIREIVRRSDKDRFEHANKKWIDAANHYMGQSPSQIKNNGKPGKE